MKPDSVLLHLYATRGDESAFAEVVRRHVNLVYASAVRMLNGDTALAEDVTQAAFTELARNAAVLAERESIAGWLHTTARYLSSHAIRSEQRRRAREQEAIAMNEQNATPDLTWMQLRPLIDEAVGYLQEPERNAVLLRFFEDKSHREVGEALGLTENAARMRVERAVEKLRSYFTRRGVTTTGALLFSTLGSKAASTAAPPAFALALTGKSLLYAQSSSSLAASMGGKNILTSKVAALIAGVAVVSVATTMSWYNFHKNPPQAVASSTGVSASPEKKAAAVAAPKDSAAATEVLPAVVPIAVAASALPVVAASANDAQSVADQTTTQVFPESQSSQAPQNSTTLNQNATANSQPTQSTPVRQNSIANSLAVKPVLAVISGIATNFKPGQNPNDPYLVFASAGELKGKTITAIAGGATHYLALCSDGTMAAFGYDDVGQLGDRKSGRDHNGMPLFNSQPVLVDERPLRGRDVTAIAAGANYSLALCSDGSVFAWGGGPACFSATATNFRDQPTQVNMGVLRGKKVTAMAAGFSHCLFLCSDGSLISWGSNKFGEMGANIARDTAPRLAPPAGTGPVVVINGFSLQPPSPANARAMVQNPAAQGYHEPALVDRSGVLRDKTIVAIAAGVSSSVVLCSDGTLAQWGRVYHQDAKNVTSITPALVPARVNTKGALLDKTVRSIAAGDGIFLVVCADGTAAQWGGLSADTPSADPVLIDPTGVLSGKKIINVSTGFTAGNGLVLCSDGTLARLQTTGSVLDNLWNRETMGYPVALDRGIVLVAKAANR